MKIILRSCVALVGLTFTPALGQGSADMPAYAFAKPGVTTEEAAGSDAMIEAIRGEIRAKYGDKVDAGDVVALKALAADDRTIQVGAKENGPIRFSSDEFSAPSPKGDAKKDQTDPERIVAGMSPEQIRAVMMMAQAMSGAQSPDQAQEAGSQSRTVTVGNGQNMLIQDWVAGLDGNGDYYIENSAIPGSRVMLHPGDVVGALGPVRDMRVSGGQTQVTFASGDMIVGDSPNVKNALPGDDLSGEIIVSGAAPAAPALSIPASSDQAEDVDQATVAAPADATLPEDPQHSMKGKTMSDSTLAPTRSARPMAKPSRAGEISPVHQNKSS